MRQLEARGQCWVCGVGATSGDVTSLPEARRIIAVVSRGGDPGAEAVAWLRELRRPLDKWRLVRKELEDSDKEKENRAQSTLSGKRCRSDYYRINLAKKHFDNSPLLTHNFAHTTRHSFLPKTNDQPLKKSFFLRSVE